MQRYETAEQLSLFGHDSYCGKTCREPSPAEHPRERTSASSSRRSSALKTAPVQCLDLTPGHGDLLGRPYWEMNSAWLGDVWTLNSGVSPREERGSSLSQILQASPHPKYYLSPKACLGILRRANERGKELPPQLKEALMAQAGLSSVPVVNSGLKAYHINQRDEGIDLGEISGALMATSNITDGCLTPWDTQQSRIFPPEGVSPTLAGADGGGGRNPGGLLLAVGVVSKGNGDCFLTAERHTTLGTGGGQAGQGYPCVLTAAFSAGQGAKAGGIGYQTECAPTLKAAESGTNMVPSVLCLNDQGGQRMGVSKGITGTLRAQMEGHPPLVLASQQGGADIGIGVCPTITAAAGMSGNNQPVLFENHGLDSRYTGPHEVSPTISASAGTGGNNLPLVADANIPPLCIAGNIIDRQPQNGGNGLGCQEEIAYTLTATDRHAVFSRQRVDIFKGDSVASTQSARQHKDATDLIYHEIAGALTGGDQHDPDNQHMSREECVEERALLIRRLTPLECERLQGFPDGWTDIPGASDSSRYKALGNSVAIPCVEYILRGVALALRAAG